MSARIAPTPSGFLHVGNAVNFVLTDDLAQAVGSTITLRIDDVDAPRTRPEFLEDIFRVLDWLGIEWQVGPRSSADMESWSQARRMHHYRHARDELLAHDKVFYVCECSRTERLSSGCTCADRHLPLENDRSTLRMRWRSGVDPVIWRRDGLPASHLTSVVDDQLLAVTLVVRGEDLRESSEFQMELSRFLPGTRFSDIRLVHHPLVLDRTGHKLSKSAGAGAAPMPLDRELRAEVRAIAAHFRVQLDQVNR